MELIVRVPGSCGELAQGYTKGQPYLVTCPINWYTEVRVTDREQPSGYMGTKSMAALDRTLAYFGNPPFPYALSVSSPLPPEKGMASSSADIGAVAVAAAAALGKVLTEEEVARIASSIEATDGVFCRGVVALNYGTGQILRRYGSLPSLKIAVFDTGGQINTAQFHRQYDGAAKRAAAESSAPLSMLVPPYTAERIGAAATCSSRLHQQVLPKEGLETILAVLPQLGSVGINVAHSGTVAGLLFPPDCTEDYLDMQAAPFVSSLVSWSYMGAATLCSGGWTIQRRR
ncbi:GHMP kinase [uncultured Megasphaera sp.]|uniref:GHMP family kinase ATP-binding protein n=1 Tax=uncultured Megasphaera sp. TaxID=165188 RepID=UPI0026582CB2|nr:GHMP kinase [uncultured Megasphaera sp.]